MATEYSRMRVNRMGKRYEVYAGPADTVPWSGVSDKPALTTVPASSTATGDTGDWAYDDDFFYQCVATDTWVAWNHYTTFPPMANIKVAFGDSPSIDAFSRLRISNPEGVFDAQFTYDLQPLLYEQIVAETGASVAHNATNRSALLTFASTPTGGQAYMQSFEHMRYQPGKSMLALVTFTMGTGVADVVKFAGYSSGDNGIEFRLNGTTKEFVVFSDSSNGDVTVTQDNWNLDPLDGTGDSGITLDLTKTQILVIDLQALYVGRVRVGFDIDGLVVYAHEFLHANTDAHPYVQTASLPIRCGMTCTATVSTTMEFICSSVVSEGGQEDVTGYSFSQGGTVTAGNGSATHILSLRPKATFNSIANRSKFVLESVEVLVTGNNPVKWELCIGQAISGTTTFSDVNATYSAFEYNTAGTVSGSPAAIIATGYVAASATAKSTVSYKLANRTPITLDAAGAVRANGTLTLLVTGLGATSACQASINWRELR